MDAHPDAPLLQLGDCCGKFRIAVAAVDPFPGAVKGGLEPQLHREVGAAGDLLQIVQHLRRQTVRTGGDAQSHCAGQSDKRLELLPEHLHRSIGIGMRLEIRDIPCLRPLAPAGFDPRPKLLHQGCAGQTGMLAAAPGGTVGTSAPSPASIDIRAGEPRIQRDFHHPSPVPAAVLIFQRVITLVGITVFKRILHRFVPFPIRIK